MHLELLLEEPSAEVALQALLPKIAPGTTFRLHPHGGKPELLARLPGKLQGYRSLLRNRPDWRVIVLLDEDRSECTALKRQVVDIGRRAGLQGALLVRIAVEELEAWFIGDMPALLRAYPRIPQTLRARRRFRDPDAVPGGTWEALEGVLQKEGYYLSGLPKIEAARRIAAYMDVESNDSRSFCSFRDGIRRLVASRV